MGGVELAGRLEAPAPRARPAGRGGPTASALRVGSPPVRSGRLGRLQGRRAAAVPGAEPARAAAAAAAGAEDNDAPAGRRRGHAVLHDFCLVLPFGALLAVGGLAAAALGAGHLALGVAAAGAATLLLANLSLRAWRAGRSAAPFTLASAALAEGVAYFAWSAARRGAGRWPAALAATALLASAALVYNVLAGGNPPRRPPVGA
jgi:hypothetical protein